VKLLVAAAGVALLVCSPSSAGNKLVPTPIGVGVRYHPSASNALVERGMPIGSLECSARRAPRSGVHLELFAHGRVVIVPAGIGIAPPLRRQGALVTSGRCSYAVRTREPTGVIEIAGSRQLTLGDVFAVWGKPLGRRRLIAFRATTSAPVRAYVNGSIRRSDPRSIALRPHAEIVLELGGYVPPHTSYRFPKGL
jgi:hypothetical protein